MGVVLGIADRVGALRRTIDDMTLQHALMLGGAQALALIPGVSRSGATISMGRFLGYEREAATRFAFLLAIPAVIGAGLFQLPEIPGGENAYGVGPTLVATVVSFVVGYAAIAWLLRYVTHPVLPAVRDLPGGAGHARARPGRHRGARRRRLTPGAGSEPAGLLEDPVEHDRRAPP